jgi:transcriptional regulator with XRE-family HTH domain
MTNLNIKNNGPHNMAKRARIKKPTTIGEFVVWFRAKRQLTQKDLSLLMEFSQIYLSQVENDQYDLPRDFIRKLYKRLDADETQTLDTVVLSILKRPVRD